MAKSPDRSYRSDLRQKQADETRRKIADAARRLFLTVGFDGTTIDAIAREAGVAAQTVYSTFGSKRGILVELMERSAFGPSTEEAIRQVVATHDPIERLRLIPRIARQVYDARRAELELLQGTGAIAPELAALAREIECQRFEAQKLHITLLSESGRLRPGLSVSAARDILWALTGWELYRSLVQERGWSSDQYEAWLGELLVASLVSPVPEAETKKPSRK
jgi:AcrR family transcriptional regulator